MSAHSRVPMEGAQIQLTISVGVAMDALGDSPESLLNRADRNLYSCKQSGRNGAKL